MNNKKFIFEGVLEYHEGSEHDAATMYFQNNHIPLVTQIKYELDEFDDGKSKLQVTYYLSEDKKDLEEIEEAYLKTLFGMWEVEDHIVYGSSWTGQYGYDETFIVGGHDIIEELKDHHGKYCFIKVQVHPE